MVHEFSRTEMLIGSEGLVKLKNARVVVFGIGGVGSYTVEGLVRAGVGNLVLVDDDCICLTNINRQLHATRKTLGRAKVEVMKERINEINPEARVETFREFYLPGSGDRLLDRGYDYIVDAVDTVTAKLDLVVEAKKRGIDIISCMGMGNKLDPTKIQVADIYSTSVCPLARVMRSELRKRGVGSLKVVYSTEAAIKPLEGEKDGVSLDTRPEGFAKRQVPGSVSFVPSVAGLIIVGQVVRDLIDREG